MTCNCRGGPTCCMRQPVPTIDAIYANAFTTHTLLIELDQMLGSFSESIDGAAESMQRFRDTTERMKTEHPDWFDEDGLLRGDG